MVKQPSENRTIIKNFLSLGIAEFAGKAIAVIYMIYFLRIIGPEGNGIINFAKGFVQYFMIFVILGFDQVAIMEVSKNRNLLNTYTNAIVTIRIFIALICYAIISVLAVWFSESLGVNSLTTQIILIFGINLFANAIILTWVFLAIEEPNIIAIRTVTTNLLNLVGIYIFVHNANDIKAAAWVIVIAYLINSLWFVLVYFKRFGAIKFNFDFKLWISIIRASFSIGLIWLVITMYHYIDVTMLGFLTTERETGLFSAAHSFLLMMVIPSQVLQSLFFPKFSKVETSQELKELNGKFTKMLMVIGIYLAYTGFIYSDLIISLLGKKYSDASEIMSLISVTIFCTYVSITYFSSLIAQKKSNIVLIASVSGLIINAVSNYFLIPMYGGNGAAISTIFSETTVAIVLAIIYQKFYSHNFTMVIAKNLIVGTLAFIPGFFLLKFGLNNIIAFVLSTILYVALLLVFKLISIEEIKRIIKK